MEPKLKWPLSLVFLVTLAGSALGGANTLFERQGDDGSVELTNIPEDGGDYRVVARPPSRTSAATGSGSVSGPENRPSAPANIAPEASFSANTPPSDAGPVPMRERLRSLYDAARAAREAAMRQH